MLAGEQTVASVAEVLGRRRGDVDDVVGVIREQLGVRAEAAWSVLGADVLLGEGLRATEIARADGGDAMVDVRGRALGGVDLQREDELLGDVAGSQNCPAGDEAGCSGHSAETERGRSLFGETRRKPTSSPALRKRRRRRDDPSRAPAGASLCTW